MDAAGPAPTPLRGRTYSLYGHAPTSDGYYASVAALADVVLERWPDAAEVVAALRRATRRPRALRKPGRTDQGSIAAFVLGEAGRRLSPYLLDVERHVRELPLTERWGSMLAMTREQYLLAMVEIELADRAGIADFLACQSRIALLPHCARAREPSLCAARPVGLDYVCAACTPECVIDGVSRLLRRHRVKPYIWLHASLSALLAEHRDRPRSLGVLGIACIPELAHGMREVARAGIPVLGVPLDANRCARWLGRRQPTSINVRHLEALLECRL